MMTVGAQLEDVLSWQCGHPQVRSMQASAGKDGTEASGDLQLDVLSNLERHVDRLSAFSDEEDEAELHNLYMVCPSLTKQHEIVAWENCIQAGDAFRALSNALYYEFTESSVVEILDA